MEKNKFLLIILLTTLAVVSSLGFLFLRKTKTNPSQISDNQTIDIKVDNKQEEEMPKQSFSFSNILKKINLYFSSPTPSISLMTCDRTKIFQSFEEAFQEPQKVCNLSISAADSLPLWELPPDIEKLTNLEELSISRTNLRTFPLSLTKFPHLRKLDLSRNQIASIPAEINNLTSLETLFLNDNQIASIPSEIGSLTKLSIIQLSRNNISFIPTEIGKLTNLNYLYLEDNNLNSQEEEKIKNLLPNTNIFFR